MTESKRKKLYWLFKILSILVSCTLPIWAICEKFPIWKSEHGSGRTIGFGVILIIFVLLVIFRRTVFDFIRDHFNLKHAPPLTVWVVMLILSYILIYIGAVMQDMTTVFWMGLIGCCIGNVFSYISERFAKAEVTPNES